MKQLLSALVRSGLLALGLCAFAAPANAGTAGVAGAAISDAAERIANASPVTAVDRRGRGHYRRYYRDRDYRYRYRPRYVRPRSGFYLQFGTPGFYYGRPYYPSPYYARPYYPRPAYRPRVSLTRSHIDWCYGRYRSYRHSDNTFQPYNGPRRQCISPFMR